MVLCAGTLLSQHARAEELALENRHIRRVLTKDGDVWRTVRLSRADGSDAIDMTGDEFLIRLIDGRELTTAHYVCPVEPRVERSETGHSVTIGYEPLTQPAPAVMVKYWLDDEPYVRKAITLQSPEAFAVDRLDVERFRTKLPCAQGGRGEPVFIGASWFVGLEYPGSEAAREKGHVVLSHFPGSASCDETTGAYIIASRTAVAGVGAVGDPIKLAFSDYLDTIRRPSRILLHYNSWYDFRNEELTQLNLLRTFEAFKANVLEPFGLRMDVFVPDDGWQNPASIWAPREALYPDGFRPLADALEARGTRLGLWIPFNGFNLDVEWGAARGYEKSDRGRYYCLVGPKYNAKLRKTLETIIREGRIGYFKHDFNQLQCTAEGHGHLPDERHGHEANLNAQLDLLALERALLPDIHLNVTSYVWHSPWWLMHADTIWMAAGDFGYNNDWPQLSPREWAMSYRDAHFHKLYAERDTLVPLSAMMTHGIIHGRYQLLGGEEETLREWSDYVVMYYGRGVQLMEWYITPELMTPDRWKVLGHATRWAIENRDVLENVVLVGGDPRKGQPYGYAHWSDDRGIIVVRNPDIREQAIEVPFDKSVRYRGKAGRPFYGRLIYPCIERLPEPFPSGRPIRLTVPGCSVLVAEFGPNSRPAPDTVTPPPPVTASARKEWSEDGSIRLRARVPVPDEDTARCDAYFVVRNDVRVGPRSRLLLEGSATTPRTGRGPNWTLYSIDLQPHRGSTVELVLEFDDPESPFSRPDMTASAWLVMDRPVEVPAIASTEHLPLPISNGHRRQTVQMLEDTEIPERTLRRSLDQANLEGVQAAKLRIWVFDSNAEPRYRDKFILLNGERLARVPANRKTLSVWEEHVIDIPPEQLERIRKANEVEITNPAGDYFKATGLALAVRLADGTWVNTGPYDQVHSSTAKWYHAEGIPFTEGRSGPIRLAFD
jgi:hypothetical protein